MNEQKPTSPNSIGWTRVPNPDGTIRRGWTWNFGGGCFHDCEWTMPDGSVAVCYAGDTAEGLAQNAYPQGFRHHYTRPHALTEPLRKKAPSGIFLDSMWDWMGHWVPDEDIYAVLDVIQRAHWQIFQALTKAAPRLLKFLDHLPPNLWLGVSLPPSRMHGKTLSEHQRQRMFYHALDVLTQIKAHDSRRITFLSLEPLSMDAAHLLWESEHIPSWIIVGAASNGKATYQPDPAHLNAAHDYAHFYDIPVYHKENLEVTERRTEFPAWWTIQSAIEGSVQLELFSEAATP